MNSDDLYVYKEIGYLFDFPETNSKITKKYCIEHAGSIPVYASSKDENSTLGFIEDNLKGVKYYDDCLSWNRNGSVGYVFLRDHRFSTNEDHRAMLVKPEFKESLDREYLKFEIEKQLLLNGFSYLDKCGVSKIKGVNILIPVKENGKFDLKRQVSIASKYKSVEKIKSELTDTYKNFDADINIEDCYETKEFSLDDLFIPQKGSAKYTKKYFHDHAGDYPVYSSQTLANGEIARIDTYDYDTECLTWTTDGVYAGTVFYRKGKFSITTHCGVLKLKPEFKACVDFEFLFYALNVLLPLNTLGEWGNKRIGSERIKELYLSIPVTSKGMPDLDKQIVIASQYKKFQALKQSLREDFTMLIKPKVSIVDENSVKLATGQD